MRTFFMTLYGSRPEKWEERESDSRHRWPRSRAAAARPRRSAAFPKLSEKSSTALPALAALAQLLELAALIGREYSDDATHIVGAHQHHFTQRLRLRIRELAGACAIVARRERGLAQLLARAARDFHLLTHRRRLVVENLEDLIALGFGQIEPAQQALRSALAMAAGHLGMRAIGHRLRMCSERNSKGEAARNQEASDMVFHG
jgi:hypothetical protein